MPAEITRILAKQRRKEPLTDGEKEFLKAYYRKYNPTKKTVRGPDWELKDWQERAEAAGEDFSPWVMQQVRQNLFGQNEEVASLNRQLQAERDEKTALLRSVGDLSSKVSRYEEQFIHIDDRLRHAYEGVLKAQQGVQE